MYYHFDWNFRNKNNDIIENFKQSNYKISNAEIDSTTTKSKILKILEKIDNY